MIRLAGFIMTALKLPSRFTSENFFTTVERAVLLLKGRPGKSPTVGEGHRGERQQRHRQGGVGPSRFEQDQLLRRRTEDPVQATLLPPQRPHSEGKKRT